MYQHHVRRRQRRVPFVAMGLSLLCLTACGVNPSIVDKIYPPQNDQPTMRVLDTSSLDSQVLGILTSDYRIIATDVECPSDEQVTVGNMFTCAVTINGAQEEVQVTVVTSSGEFRVSSPR